MMQPTALRKRVDRRSILLEKIKDQKQNKQGYFVREDNQANFYFF